MSAFLSSLASIGNQFGEAKEGARQEKEARAEKLKKMDVEQAYLDIARQSEERQGKAQDEASKRGDILKVGSRLWSISQGKFIDTQQQSNPFESLKQYIAQAPKEEQAELASVAKMTAEGEPNDPQKAIQAVLGRHKDLKAETDRREDAATRERERREDKLTADKERRLEHDENRREMEGFQRQMVDMRLAEKQKYMSPQERQVYDTIKQVSPAVDRTIAFLEGTKSSDGKPLTDENSYVFGDRSALMQHLRFRGYKFGTAQEDVSQQLIKNAALIQVLGARPWMTMGRGKYIYETISQHLPSPTDTPMLLYDKLTWLRDNVLADARDSLSGYVQPGGANQSAPDHNADPMGVLQ